MTDRLPFLPWRQPPLVRVGVGPRVRDPHSRARGRGSSLARATPDSTQRGPSGPSWGASCAWTSPCRAAAVVTTT